MAVYTINGKNILFIHIPKAGGKAIGVELAKAGETHFRETIAFGRKTVRPRHADASVLEAIFSPSMFDLVLAVVNDPVDRMVLEFRSQTRKSGLHLGRLLGFDRWLSLSLARAKINPSYRDNHFRPQGQFLAFDAKIFRYDDGLEKPLNEVSRVTGHDFPPVAKGNDPLPPVNVSAKSRALINNFYDEDFRRFGYAKSS